MYCASWQSATTSFSLINLWAKGYATASHWSRQFHTAPLFTKEIPVASAPLRFPSENTRDARSGGGERGGAGGEGGGRREEGLETLLLGLKAKTNSGRHGGCAIQSWCNGIPRTSGNWDDASRTKVNGFGSARNAMKFRVSPWRWKYREIVDRAGQHPRNVARYPNAVRNAGMAAPVIAA